MGGIQPPGDIWLCLQTSVIIYEEGGVLLALLGRSQECCLTPCNLHNKIYPASKVNKLRLRKFSIKTVLLTKLISPYRTFIRSQLMISSPKSPLVKQYPPINQPWPEVPVPFLFPYELFLHTFPQIRVLFSVVVSSSWATPPCPDRVRPHCPSQQVTNQQPSPENTELTKDGAQLFQAQQVPGTPFLHQSCMSLGSYLFSLQVWGWGASEEGEQTST